MFFFDFLEEACNAFSVGVVGMDGWGGGVRFSVDVVRMDGWGGGGCDSVLMLWGWGGGGAIQC